jgi:hypothetical protein
VEHAVKIARAYTKRPGLITLSQSGETADTLAALRLSKELGYLGSLAICNVPGSSLVRESDLALMTKAGTEIGVASTKAFTTQLTVLLMLVAKLARLKGQDASVEHDIVHGLQALPSRIEQMLSQDKRIEALAEDFSDKHHALFLGRGDGTNLWHVAQTQTFGERQRWLVQHLTRRDIRARVLIVEALLAGQVIRGFGDRQVAGLLVPFGRVFRFCQEIEELGNAFIGAIVFTLHHPQARAADDGVLRCAFHVSVVGHHAHA